MTENQTKQGYLKNHQNTDNYLLYKYLYIYIHSWHTHCNIISETKKYFPEEKMRYLVKPTASVNLLNDFDKMLDSFFDNSREYDYQHPAVDVREEEDKFVLEADLPGMTEKDIEVKVDDKLLTISSVKKENAKEKKDGWLIRERKESSFSRSFVIPENADRENIKAEFRNGVLTLDIEKKAALKPKNIKIQVG